MFNGSKLVVSQVYSFQWQVCKVEQVEKPGAYIGGPDPSHGGKEKQPRNEEWSLPRSPPNSNFGSNLLSKKG